MNARFLIPVAIVLAACSPSVPNSAPRGPAFTDLEAERARRDAALAGAPQQIAIGPAISDEDAGAAGGTAAAANTAAISDEQEFDAVAARETIESDAERLERQRQAYTVIQPTAVPERQGSGGPNIVAFALQTRNAVGEKLYRRSGLNAENRFARACARFASPDLAQADFLEAGGPERDRRGMDPDGDGFACDWDPTPFRNARQAAQGGR